MVVDNALKERSGLVKEPTLLPIEGCPLKIIEDVSGCERAV